MVGLERLKGHGLPSVNLEEGEVDRGNEEEEGDEVVPMQLFALEKEGDEDGENGKRYNLLQHLELHETERPSVARIADAVGWYHEEVLKQGNAP